MKYKERLLIELRQLTERIALLNNAINSDNRDKIDKEQLELMENQLNVMIQYEDILMNRILIIMDK